MPGQGREGVSQRRLEIGRGNDVLVTALVVASFLSVFTLPAGAPLTFTLDYSAPLEVTGRIYSGTWEAPDLNDSLTPPVRVGADGEQELWLISDPLPEDTADGPYTFLLTATNVTSPTDFHWAADLLWVSDWVAPPLAPWQKHPVYQPLVLRSSSAP